MFTWMGKARYHVKVWLSRWFTIIECCQVCGVHQPLVWTAPDELWSELTGYQPIDGDNMPGVFCPQCFDRIAENRGILLRWVPHVERRDLKPRV